MLKVRELKVCPPSILFVRSPVAASGRSPRSELHLWHTPQRRQRSARPRNPCPHTHKNFPADVVAIRAAHFGRQRLAAATHTPDCSSLIFRRLAASAAGARPLRPRREGARRRGSARLRPRRPARRDALRVCADCTVFSGGALLETPCPAAFPRRNPGGVP